MEITKNNKHYNKYKTIHIIIRANFKDLNSHIKKVTYNDLCKK